MHKLTNNHLNKKKIQLLITQLLTAVGENLKRAGLIKTPIRVAKMYKELFGGYEIDPKISI